MILALSLVSPASLGSVVSAILSRDQKHLHRPILGFSLRYTGQDSGIQFIRFTYIKELGIQV